MLTVTDTTNFNQFYIPRYQFEIRTKNMSDTFFNKDFILLLIRYSFFLIERKLYVHVIYCNLTIHIINSYLFYSQAFLYIYMYNYTYSFIHNIIIYVI